MNEDQKAKAGTSSRVFAPGVEAGLHSEDTKYRQAGYKLRQELSDRDPGEFVKENMSKESNTPLFLKETLNGHNLDAQDEKDESAE